MLSYQSLKFREPSTVAISNRIVKNPHGTSADMGGEKSVSNMPDKVHHGILTTMEVDVHVSMSIAPRAT